MPYDFDHATDRGSPAWSGPVLHGSDLEAIVMLLELAAIYLTPAPGTTFTLTELLAQAREIGGEAIVLAERDAKIVVDHAKFLKKETGGCFSLR